MSLRTLIAVPGRPALEVLCATPAQCTRVADMERAASYTKKPGAAVRIDAKREDGRWQPLVVWLYGAGRWQKELW